jgi:hypothetical protein
MIAVLTLACESSNSMRKWELNEIGVLRVRSDEVWRKQQNTATQGLMWWRDATKAVSRSFSCDKAEPKTCKTRSICW